MRKLLPVLVAVLIAFSWSGLAWAQSQQRGNQGGQGSQPKPTQDGLDVPLGNPTPEEWVDPDADEDDDFDPEDEPPNFYDEELPATESVTYVIDISGSMGWGSSTYTTPDGDVRNGTPLDRAKFELVKSINNLSEDFEFNVFAYSCSVRNLWGSRREANEANKSAARAWVMALQDTGATGTGPATVAALQEEDDTVVLLTDGSPNCGCSGSSWDYTECHKSMILSNNPNGCSINTFGIGDYGEFAQFLRDLASSTGGIYVHID